MPRKKQSPAKAKALTKETKQLHVQLIVEIPKKGNEHAIHWDWEKITGLKVKSLIVADVPTSEEIR